MTLVELDWTSFRGVQAIRHQGEASVHSAVAAAPFRCPCCDDRGVVISAASESGESIAVQLERDEALALARQILSIVAELGDVPAARLQQ